MIVLLKKEGTHLCIFIYGLLPCENFLCPSLQILRRFVYKQLDSVTTYIVKANVLKYTYMNLFKFHTIKLYDVRLTNNKPITDICIYNSTTFVYYI